jgi:hypothetical protein
VVFTFFTIHCVYTEQSTIDSCQTVESAIPSNESVELEDDIFFAQLCAASQETFDTELDDKLAYCMQEADKKDCKSVLYQYLAPYYLSVLLLYNRLKERFKEYQNLFVS